MTNYNLYLDYVNDFLTTEKMAEQHNVPEESLKRRIAAGMMIDRLEALLKAIADLNAMHEGSSLVEVLKPNYPFHEDMTDMTINIAGWVQQTKRKLNEIK
jgi:hypothetical protein